MQVWQEQSLSLCLWPHEALSQMAEPVQEFGEGLASLAREMERIMDLSQGIGLAANQVGVLKRVVLVSVPLDSEDTDVPVEPSFYDRLWVLVNPVIVKREGRRCAKEGCLSFPGISDYVVRDEFVACEAQDLEGNPIKISGYGLLAACLSHEVDHLNGVTFVERMSPQKSQKALRRIKA